MKKILFATLIAAAGISAGTAAQAADVGVSVSIGQPGFYGQIDLGNAPRPQVIYTQPVWVQRGPERLEPIYLRVPPGYERNWGRYCHRYEACGRPVYFVRDTWYRNTYVPHYHDHYYGGGWQEARRDRDHDGVPDWRDRDGGHRRDRDNDGIPDRRDHHDDRRDDRRDDRGHRRD